MRPPSDREELRARVYARAKQLRLRRRLQIAGALVSTVAVIAALAGFALLPNDPVRDVRDVAAEPTATATAEAEAAATPDLTPSPTPEPAQTPEPTPTPTPLECRNSFNPECGPFRWDPEPPSHGTDDGTMTIDFETEPATPKAGEEMTFVVTVTDDSPREPLLVEGGYGDGVSLPVAQHKTACEDTRTAYGPWTPPEPKKTVTVRRVTHVYQEAGTFDVSFHFATYQCYITTTIDDPRGTEKTGRYTLTVSP